MKRNLGLMALGLAGLFTVWSMNGCGSGTPTGYTSPPPTPTPYNNGTGTVVVNDAATGACMVRVWLDGTGPITISGGTVYNFSSVAEGPHTLTINSGVPVTCGSVLSCQFILNAGSSNPVTTTGTSCSIFVYSNEIETASITDNGCNYLFVGCPVY